jgi:hypothetical protein
MVYFMREAKRVDDFSKKEASGKKRERAREKERESNRERDILFRVARTQELFPPKL